jgi:hypothetical protein
MHIYFIFLTIKTHPYGHYTFCMLLVLIINKTDNLILKKHITYRYQVNDALIKLFRKVSL